MNTLQDWLQRLNARSALAPDWNSEPYREALRLIDPAGDEASWVELSRHRNGFIREIAVRTLCEQPGPEALKALIERQNDWVPQIRELAVQGVGRYLAPSSAGTWLLALEPLMALAARHRADHRPVLAKVRAVLQLPENRDLVHAHFLTRQSKVACYLFNLLLDSDPTPRRLLRSALAHRELTVRLLAIVACQALPIEDARPLLLDALARPGAKVRVCAMRALLPMLDDPKLVLRSALLDAAPSIRNLAHWMAARHGVDAQAVLAERLAQPLPTRKHEWLGVLGLATELNIELPQYWQAQALQDACVSVRKTVVRRLGAGHLPALLKALDDPADAVFQAAIGTLDTLAWATIRDELDTRLARDWHRLPTARRAALIGLRPPWQQLAFLLARLEQEPDLMAFWLRQVNLWCNRHYTVLDHTTARTERALLVERLQALAERGLVNRDAVRRIT